MKHRMTRGFGIDAAESAALTMEDPRATERDCIQPILIFRQKQFRTCFTASKDLLNYFLFFIHVPLIET